MQSLTPASEDAATGLTDVHPEIKEVEAATPETRRVGAVFLSYVTLSGAPCHVQCLMFSRVHRMAACQQWVKVSGNHLSDTTCITHTFFKSGESRSRFN